MDPNVAVAARGLRSTRGRHKEALRRLETARTAPCAARRPVVRRPAWRGLHPGVRLQPARCRVRSRMGDRRRALRGAPSSTWPRGASSRPRPTPRRASRRRCSTWRSTSAPRWTSSPACDWATGRSACIPAKLGLVGHGFGASTAVFAAAGMPAKPKAVVAAFPTVTTPRAEEAAGGLQVPGLILTDPGDPMSLRSNAVELARVWDGATLRAMPKAKAGRSDRGPQAGAGGRPARRRPQHPEDGAGADDGLPAVHADR